MGCGSSATAVQTFQDPDENRSYVRSTTKDRQNGSAKQKPSSAKSRDNSASSKPASAASKRSKKSIDKRPKSSSSSSSSNDKSRDSKHVSVVRQTSGGSRRSTGSARQKETQKEEQTEVQVISFDNGQIDNEEKKDENQNEDVDTLVNQVRANIVQNNSGGGLEKENGAQDLHVFVNVNRGEQHEERAKLVEERRKLMEAKFDELEEQEITDMNLPGIDVPEKEERTVGNNYTIDDIVNHNSDLGKRDWFKYGKKVYSVDLMTPIVKARMAGYLEQQGYEVHTTEAILSFNGGYPVYTARSYGVTRKDLKKVLIVCVVGNVVEIDHESLIARLKQCVENTLEALDELEQSEYVGDFKDQLNRWLQEYPTVQVYNELPQAGVDPNEQSFPLPKPILFDPLILRKWIEDWEDFDTEVTGEVAWTTYELLNEDFGDAHETFANIVKGREDESLAEFDMTIDGEAAWNVIDLDILKDDKTTEGQENIWILREKRRNLYDTAWMEKRRGEIADAFISRHELDANFVSPFLSFCENLEIAWKQFQELCEQEFVPPKRAAPGTTKKQMHEKRRKSVDSIGGSIDSDHDAPNDQTVQMHDGVQVSENVVFHNSGDEINNDTNEGQNNNEVDEGENNNAFLTLAEDDETYDPVVFTQNDEPNEPVGSNLETDRSGDKVDGNLHAVDKEPEAKTPENGENNAVQNTEDN